MRYLQALWGALLGRVPLTTAVYAVIDKPEPSLLLKPGDCECGHGRCTHEDGHRKCNGMFPPDEDSTEWTYCTCVIYIRGDESDDDEPEEAPTPSDLERLFSK